MSAVPQNPWVAKVHAFMLSTKTIATSREIQKRFGRPPGRRVTSDVMGAACCSGWFAISERADAGRRGNRFKALEKLTRAEPERTFQRSERVSLGDEVRGRFASIWDFAAASQARVPGRGGPAISTRLSPLAQWVSA